MAGLARARATSHDHVDGRCVNDTRRWNETRRGRIQFFLPKRVQGCENGTAVGSDAMVEGVDRTRAMREAMDDVLHTMQEIGTNGGMEAFPFSSLACQSENRGIHSLYR